MVVNVDDFNLTTIGVAFVVVSGLVAALIAYVVSKRWDAPRRASSSDTNSEIEDEDGKTSKHSAQIAMKSRKADKGKPAKSREAQFEHPWLLTTLKGHVGRVCDTDFSADGKSLVSAGDDRALFIWKLKDFAEREHKYVRGNVEFDHARLVRFAPDSKSLILALNTANKVAVYKLVRKDDGGFRLQVVDNVVFPQEHEHDIVGIGIACTGRYIMSASSDCKIAIYDLQGNLLKQVEPKLNKLHSAVVSPCGRFVAASGFTPDVLVWEVQFDRQGAFQSMNRAFELKGHTSGVYAVNFNQNSSRAVTVSKDGTWKVFDTDIRFQQGEEPHLLARHLMEYLNEFSGQWDILRSAPPTSVFVAITQSGDCIAIGADSHIQLVNVLRPTHQFPPLLSIHSDRLTSLRISSCGRLVASSGDRVVRVFHNIPGYESVVSGLEKARETAQGDAQKRRLDEQLQEARLQLNEMLKKNR